MLNHIVIIGRLVRDPELRRTGNGIAVSSFTVAVDRDFKSGENGQKETDFIDCVAWRSTGEFVSKYFSKGETGRTRTGTRERPRRLWRRTATLEKAKKTPGVPTILPPRAVTPREIMRRKITVDMHPRRQDSAATRRIRFRLLSMRN